MPAHSASRDADSSAPLAPSPLARYSAAHSALFLLAALALATACTPPNSSDRFLAATDAIAARTCLYRGYRYFRRVYPSDVICLHERDRPEVTDAKEWLAQTGDGTKVQ